LNPVSTKVVRGTKTIYSGVGSTLISKFSFATGLGRVEGNLKSSAPLFLKFVLDEDWPSFSQLTCEQQKEYKKRAHFELPAGGGHFYQPIKQHLRPHVWYLVAIKCNFGSSVDFDYDVTFLNPYESHFPYELEGLPAMYTGLLLLFIVAGILYAFRFVNAWKSFVTLPPVLLMFTSILVAEFVGLFFEWLNLRYFADKGEGIWWFSFFSQVFRWLSKEVLSFLLLALSSGWTILYAELPVNFPLTNPLISGGIISVNMLLVIWSHMYEDEASFHQYDNFPGLLLALLRVFLFLWAAKQLSSCLEVAQTNEVKRKFIMRLGLFITISFLAFPTMLLLACILAAYLREKVISIVLTIIQTASLFGLANLFLSRGAYFSISTLSDSLLPSKTNSGTTLPPTQTKHTRSISTELPSVATVRHHSIPSNFPSALSARHGRSLSNTLS